MKITTTVSALDSAIASLKSILTDKLVGEDLKNLIFWVRDGHLKLVANNVYITCLAEIDAELEGVSSNEDTLVAIKAKELFGVLDAYRSLKRTKATDIVFDILDTNIKLTISEEPLSESMEYADKYYCTSIYYLAKPKVTERIKNDIVSTASIPDGDLINRSDVMGYFDSLVPSILKDTRDSVATRLYFIDGYVYTAPNKYVAVMKNCLESNVMSELVVTSSVAQFMQSFFSLCEVTRVAKKESSDIILVSLQNDIAEAVIKAYTPKKAFNLSKYLDIPNEGVGVDKYFLIDVLKRASLSNEDITVSIEPESGVKITAKNFSLEVPVLVSRFNTIDKCCFSVSAELLSNLIFSYASFLGDLTFLYLSKVDDTWELTVTDNTKLQDGGKAWWTKARFRQRRV